MMLHLSITSRQKFADGHDFGAAGAYEILSGRVHFEVDPLAPENAIVVDLDKAPRNAAGLVRFSADFGLLKPADMTRGNGRVL
jgi:hypothetical protein